MHLYRLARLLVFGALGWTAANLAVPAQAPELSDIVSAPATELSAQSRSRRPQARVRVYRPVRTLPPDAVRECHAWYVQEHRPSGTVIVPRMQCWWTR